MQVLNHLEFIYINANVWNKAQRIVFLYMGQFNRQHPRHTKQSFSTEDKKKASVCFPSFFFHDIPIPWICHTIWFTVLYVNCASPNTFLLQHRLHISPRSVENLRSHLAAFHMNEPLLLIVPGFEISNHTGPDTGATRNVIFNMNHFQFQLVTTA